MTNIRPFVKQKQTSVLFYLIAIFSFFLGGGGYGSLIAFLKEKEEKKKVTISTESVNQEQYLVLYSMC